MNSPSLQLQSSPGLDELKKNLDDLRALLDPKFVDLAIPLEKASGNLSSDEILAIYSYFEYLHYEKIRSIHTDIVAMLNKQLGLQNSMMRMPALSQLQDEITDIAEGITKQDQRTLFPGSNHTVQAAPAYLSNKLGLEYKSKLSDITIEELAVFLRYLTTYMEWREEVILAKTALMANGLSAGKRSGILDALNLKNP